MAGEYVNPKYADLVARYRQAEQAQAPATVWPGRPDAVNRIVTFDTTPPTSGK